MVVMRQYEWLLGGSECRLIYLFDIRVSTQFYAVSEYAESPLCSRGGNYLKLDFERLQVIPRLDVYN